MVKCSNAPPTAPPLQRGPGARSTDCAALHRLTGRPPSRCRLLGAGSSLCDKLPATRWPGPRTRWRWALLKARRPGGSSRPQGREATPPACGGAAALPAAPWVALQRAFLKQSCRATAWDVTPRVHRQSTTLSGLSSSSVFGIVGSRAERVKPQNF